MLDEVKQYLTDQYFSRGKYAVRVDTKITELPGNKVDVVVDIKEGKRAKIEQINLVGNTKFKEKDVLGTLELKTPNWLSWYKQDDRYSREIADRAIWKNCAPTTWTAATPISRSSRRKSPSRPKKTTCTSP